MLRTPQSLIWDKKNLDTILSDAQYNNAKKDQKKSSSICMGGLNSSAWVFGFTAQILQGGYAWFVGAEFVIVDRPYLPLGPSAIPAKNAPKLEELLLDSSLAAEKRGNYAYPGTSEVKTVVNSLDSIKPYD